MKLSKIVRSAALCLTLALTALSATYAAPPAPQACSCEYCSHTGTSRPCVNFDGTTVTCGYFLAVSLCPANG